MSFPRALSTLAEINLQNDNITKSKGFQEKKRKNRNEDEDREAGLSIAIRRAKLLTKEFRDAFIDLMKHIFQTEYLVMTSISIIPFESKEALDAFNSLSRIEQDVIATKATSEQFDNIVACLPPIAQLIAEIDDHVATLFSNARYLMNQEFSDLQEIGMFVALYNFIYDKCSDFSSLAAPGNFWTLCRLATTLPSMRITHPFPCTGDAVHFGKVGARGRVVIGSSPTGDHADMCAIAIKYRTYAPMTPRTKKTFAADTMTMFAKPRIGAQPRRVSATQREVTPAPVEIAEEQLIERVPSSDSEEDEDQ